MMKAIVPLALFIAVLLVSVSWAVNLVKLSECDFQPNYQCEVIHGVGLVPIISVGTAWVDTDN